MALFGSPVEKAQRELDRAESRARELLALVAERRGAITAAEASDGPAVLAAWGADVDAATAITNTASRTSSLRGELELAERALAAARAECAAAQQALWSAEATELRSQAAAKRVEAERRLVRTERLLAELQEHEDVDFAPKPVVPPDGVVRGVPWLPPTRTERLQREADELEQQAVELEQRRVPAGGYVEEVGLDALLEQLDAQPMATVMPPASAVRAWAGRAAARVRPPTRHAEARPIDPAKVLYVLVWDDGAIDEARSTAQPMHEAQPA